MRRDWLSDLNIRSSVWLGVGGGWASGRVFSYVLVLYGRIWTARMRSALPCPAKNVTELVNVNANNFLCSMIPRLNLVLPLLSKVFGRIRTTACLVTYLSALYHYKIET